MGRSPARPHRRSRVRAARAETLESRTLLTGLTAQYFDRVDFTELKLTRTDPTVAFNWGTAAPDASMDPNGFSVRWTGRVQPQFTEDYTFYVKTDDGARLWVDGRLLIDNWVNQAVAEKSATLPLTAGHNYDIRLDYYDSTSTAQATLSWSSPSVAKQTVPASRLFPSPAGLAATYFDNPDFTGPSIARTDPSVDFNWGATPPDPAIAPTTWSATWTGQVVPQYTQTYSFFVMPEPGATAQLWVDRKLVFQTASAQGTQQVTLEADRRYDIELAYAHGTSGAALKLEWSSPSQPRQVIPNSRLVATQLGAVPTRQPTYTNPVTDKDRPDPGVIFADGAYWMIHTTGGPDTGWPLYKSTDLMTWTKVSNLLNLTNKPAFMDDGAFWAPEISRVNGAYVLTSTARSTQFADRTVIAIATASEITGPYTVRSTPIVASSASGTLDSTVFQDWDGRAYLVWKQQSASGTAANGTLRLRELDPANLTQFLPGSSETVLLNNAGGGSWERNIEEAPEVIHRGAYYYLFYSGSTIDTTYAVGVARATSLTGPYTRFPGNVPILQSNPTWGGPGHGAFVQDVDGTWWFYYHARHQDNPNFGRVQMLDKVVWSVDGWPTFSNTGTPTTTPQVGPRVDANSGTARYTLSGDAGGVATNDVFRLVRSPADASRLDVLLNGAIKLSLPFDQIENLTLNPGAGDDTLLLDFSRGDSIPGTGITFAGATGTDSVQVLGASPADAFRLTGTRLTHDTGAVTFTGVEQLALETGTFTLAADLPAVSLTATGTGTTLILDAATQHLASLTLNAAAARFAQSAGLSLALSSLSIANAGAFDLADNTLVIDYAGPSPLAAFQSYLLTGSNRGRWNGAGLLSSTAAADPGFLTALASTDDGHRVTVATTSYGDTNLDGVVDADDAAAIVLGRARNETSWSAGNFNYDTTLDADDYILFLRGAAYINPPAPAPALPATPTATDLLKASDPGLFS